ncbi:MAG: hypothetical protein ABL925_18615, partial [Methylococcales bacterium]
MFFLVVLLAAYGIASLIKPGIFLIVLPGLLPILSLAPWSGRFFLEVLDLFFWSTLAAAFWRGDFSLAGRPRLAVLPGFIILFLVVSHSIAMLQGLMPFAPIDVNAFNNYYSPYYALRVGKAFFWAVLLIPVLLKTFANDREQAREFLSLGVCLGLLGTGIAILWERGVFWDLLYGANLWGRLQSLTDFSSQYRATGLLADMHTGGEAIDGYLSMAWPFALGLIIKHRRQMTLIVGLVALPIGLYSALVTFSRGTYLAVVVSFIALGLGYVKNLSGSHPGAKSLWPVLVAIGAASVTCVFLYGKGGWYALFAAVIILSSTVAVIFSKFLRLEWQILAKGAVFLAGSILMMRGLLTSKWVDNDWDDSLLITLTVSFIMLLAGIFTGRHIRNMVTLKGLLIGLGIAVSMITVSVPIASGSYIKSRFGTTGGDFSGRLDHWKHAIDLMDSNWNTTAFGMGLGVFPRVYAWSANTGGIESTSGMRLHSDPFNTYLKLTATMDFTLGQRVNLDANQDYTLLIDVKTTEPNGLLGISICRRNILFPTLWNPTCLNYEKSIDKGDGKWQTLTWKFNIGDIGDGFQIARKPLILRISNGLPRDEKDLTGNRFIDCDNIKLLNRQGENLLSNSDFEAELDRWYMYTDFYHLPLHIKNLWVTAYFEQGLFGLIAFAGLSLYTLSTGIRLTSRGDTFAMTVLASLLGFFSVGLIGTLLDVPRVTFLFFLLQFT